MTLQMHDKLHIRTSSALMHAAGCGTWAIKMSTIFIGIFFVICSTKKRPDRRCAFLIVCPVYSIGGRVICDIDIPLTLKKSSLIPSISEMTKLCAKLFVQMHFSHDCCYHIQYPSVRTPLSLLLKQYPAILSLPCPPPPNTPLPFLTLFPFLSSHARASQSQPDALIERGRSNGRQ